MTSSATGRLTVHKGPNILTLKKELREPAFANKFHNPEIGDPNNMLVERYNFIKANNPTLFQIKN